MTTTLVEEALDAPEVPEFTQIVPRSLVIRRRPLQESSQPRAVQTARASSRSRAKQASKTANVIIKTEPKPQSTPVPQAKKRVDSGSWLLYIGLGMICALALAYLGQLGYSWGSTTLDDIRYGRPRTTQVDHFVGHELSHTPTHFTAINLKGQIYIIELPGGDPAHTRLLTGPHLAGPGIDLAPVSLDFSGDPHHPDLLVEVSTVQVRFHNTGQGYEAAR